MITTRSELATYLAADLLHHGLARYTLADYFLRDILRFQRRLRRIEYLHNRRKGPFGWITYVGRRLLNKGLGIKLGFTVPLNVFGPGLCIVHYGTIVVSPLARVGRFCRVTGDPDRGIQWSTRGRRLCLHRPGAKLFGPITIGSCVAIGANAVVNRSFPGDSTLGGVPARVISRKSTRDLGLHPAAVFSR